MRSRKSYRVDRQKKRQRWPDKRQEEKRIAAGENASRSLASGERRPSRVFWALKGNHRGPLLRKSSSDERVQERLDSCRAEGAGWGSGVFSERQQGALVHVKQGNDMATSLSVNTLTVL